MLKTKLRLPQQLLTVEFYSFAEISFFSHHGQSVTWCLKPKFLFSIKLFNIICFLSQFSKIQLLSWSLWFGQLCELRLSWSYAWTVCGDCEMSPQWWLYRPVCDFWVHSFVELWQENGRIPTSKPSVFSRVNLRWGAGKENSGNTDDKLSILFFFTLLLFVWSPVVLELNHFVCVHLLIVVNWYDLWPLWVSLQSSWLTWKNSGEELSLCVYVRIHLPLCPCTSVSLGSTMCASALRLHDGSSQVWTQTPASAVDLLTPEVGELPELLTHYFRCLVASFVRLLCKKFSDPLFGQFTKNQKWIIDLNWDCGQEAHRLMHIPNKIYPIYCIAFPPLGSWRFSLSLSIARLNGKRPEHYWDPIYDVIFL